MNKEHCFAWNLDCPLAPKIHIDKDLMNEKLFDPSEDTVIFVCGPPMMQINLKKQLMELGHPGDKVIFP